MKIFFFLEGSNQPILVPTVNVSKSHGYPLLSVKPSFITDEPDNIQVPWSISVIVLGNSNSSGRIAVTPTEKSFNLSFENVKKKNLKKF